jgi:hypothetical protein
MSEHTSLALSKRLQELGYKGEHENDWVSIEGSLREDGYDSEPLIMPRLSDMMPHANGFIIIAPAYTFTELWRDLTIDQRCDFTICMDWHRDDVAEHLAEWIIKYKFERNDYGEVTDEG